ncbi:somatostatin 6 [Chanos chanos]|uniref:Somatostatin 6 n=1 Tax=Chanos chanos TaxID=29144 RepID=A0A6J2UWW1_CHACN|nr:somatostatin-2-like [Chanos chanos]
MGLGVGVDTRSAGEHVWFIMRLMVSLVPLLLMVWSSHGTGAVPIEEKLNINEGLSKEESALLVKMLSELAGLNLTEKDIVELDSDQLLNLKLSQRSILDQLNPKRRVPCKNFFWKTFSSC